MPFLDRPADTEPDHGLLSKLSSIGLAWGTPAGMELEDLVPGETRRREIEAELEALEHGVVLGRAAAFLKRDDPTVLRVLLDGPPERRIEQAMRMEGIDRRDRFDAARAHRPVAAALSPDALLRRPAQAGPLPPRGRLDRALVRDVRGNDRAGKPAQVRSRRTAGEGRPAWAGHTGSGSVTQRKDAVKAAVDELSGELVELLQALIRLPTVNPPGEGYEAFVGDFARRLDALGYDTQVHRVPDDELETLAPHGNGLPRPSLIATLTQGDGPTVHLNGHYDVVPVGNDWTRTRSAASWSTAGSTVAAPPT